MTGARSRRLARRVLVVAAAVALVAILRPWTVRPIGGSSIAAFDATTFAASAWPRVLREATQSASQVSEVPIPADQAPAGARFVRGTGVVEGVDRQSRVGLMRIRVPGARPVSVAIQIGPVIRGTAVRDASGFIEFSDFTNQSDFAGAANALNDYVLRTVVQALPIDTLDGRTVTFLGAIGKTAIREDGAIEVVPVHLELVEGAAK